jgi:hypothetical protein
MQGQTGVLPENWSRRYESLRDRLRPARQSPFRVAVCAAITRANIGPGWDDTRQTKEAREPSAPLSGPASAHTRTSHSPGA